MRCNFFLCWVVLTALAEALSIDQSELQALHNLFDSTGGETWEWGNPATDGPVWTFHNENQLDPCADNSQGGRAVSWQGIECSRPPGICANPTASCHVQSLQLSRFKLVGYIPTSIGNLTALVELDLSLNTLLGTIPEQLGRLTSLELLYLFGNQLKGTIPPQLGNLLLLERLYLFSCMALYLKNSGS